ncbi:hypothetical protein J0A67_17125 [Algoriphagus aestuariicola]|uniref:Translocation/assembly module TamB n=1 Tax=Algoriphagus aestuariicola TaxID=1852016 RepID=A0ABS3BTP4_9BACT|nr:hypothetical protein [Algoriphagus aestuariicola]MBN7802601.1 hypothetical protein [Algoriphagus aestuariicola]
MESGKRSKHFAHPTRRKILRIAMIVVLSFLFLEFLVYFGSNIFLRKYAQQKINEATEDVYLVDFNRFSFSLIRRGFFLDGIVMKPVNPKNRKEDQALFEVTLDQIAFRNLWYNFFDKKFTIGKIYIDNPTVVLDLPPKVPQADKHPSQDGEEKISPIKALEEEIKKTVRKANLVGLLIKEVEIDHANLFFSNFLSRSDLKADNTSLLIRNIDFSTGEEWKTPFNAEGFEFELEKVTYPLADGVHLISADRVFISSLDNVIDIERVDLTPDRSKESRAYYSVGLKELRVGNVDLNKAFMTSIVEIDELILDDPELDVVSNPQVRSDSAASGDLNDFIKGSLESVRIKELSINKGKFVRSDLEDTLRNRIELDELNFKMVGFYLGEDSVKRQNQFFYGEDAAMEIKGSRIYLGDQIHLVTGEEVSVSSFKDELIVRNLSIQPRPESLDSQDPERLLKLDLAEFSVEEVGLRQMYNDGILQAEQIRILRPRVEYTELEKKISDRSRQVPLGEIVSGFLKEVSVGSFAVEEGTIQFIGSGGQRRNDIGFEQFSFRLDNILFKPEVSDEIREQVQLDEIYVKLDKYRLKLKDNLHIIMADQLTIDSKNELLEVQNLTIRPEDQTSIQSLLGTYGKTSVVDFAVPMFRAEGVDIKSIFYEEELLVHRILMPNPVFVIETYREKPRSSGESPGSNDELRDVLLGYFNAIAVDTVSMDKAQVRYVSYVEGKSFNFEEDNLSLSLKNFALDQEMSETDDKTLFSDEIDLVFNNYSFSLAGGKYEVATDQLQYNSLRKSIDVRGLVMRPNSDFQGRIQLGLQFPNVNFKGVDIEQFLFENRLDLNKLEIDKGQIEIGIDKEVAARSASADSRQPAGLGKRSLKEVLIDTIETSNSTLAINYQLDESSINSIETDFGLLVRGFRLDSAITANKDVGNLYDEVNLSLKEFKFALPDSVHTLGFSTVDIGTTKEEVVFSDFYLSPKDQFGKPGSPTLDAKIDQLILKNNKLAEIQDTGILDLRELRLVNPKLNLYLDTAEVQHGPEKTKPKSSSSLVHTILLGDVLLKNGELALHRKGQGPIPRLDFRGISVDARALNLNLLKGEQVLDLKALAEKNIQFGFENYSTITPDSLYKVDLGRVDFSQGNLRLEDVYYRPVDGNYGLLRKLPFQSDAVTARIGSIQLNGIDAESYIGNKWIKATEIVVESPKVDLFRDKRYPFDSSAQKPMPQYLMENARINADLVSLRVRNGQVRYFEFAPKGMVPGMISFDRIDLDMAPFYLREANQDYPLDKLRLGIQAYVMDTSKVNLEALMYFKSKYPMDVNVSMDSFAFAETNDFLSKTLFVKAVDGTVTNGSWNFVLNEDEARGEMEFGYTDLKIQFLDSLTLERGLGKLKIYTFGANLFAKNSNPRALSSKIAKRRIYQERDKRKFVFSAWWRATFSGLRGTLGFGRAKMPKRREEE